MLGFRDYLNYAEKNIKRAELEKGSDVAWLLIPAIIMSWISIESFVYSREKELIALPKERLDLHERAFLLEKRVRFITSGDQIGEFALEGIDRHSMEDKIVFLLAKYGTKNNHSIKESDLWRDFQDFKKLRNSLVHPKREKRLKLCLDDAKKHFRTAKNVIQMLSENIWHKKIAF